MTEYLGRQFGHYCLLRLLGRGGFAEVYLGEHVRLGMHAAVKVLHTHLVDEEIAAFQREAQLIANLRHPHIVRVLDFDVHEGIPFLVLDYAPNGSLRQKHPRGTPVALAQVVHYIQQVGSALQYAHDQRLVHRDIKPENMLLGDRDMLLLADFGIASVVHSTSSMYTQASIGTLAYMAPEQIQGKPRAASDQYALAVTVYQWLCGELPFVGSSHEIIAQHLAVPPPSLKEKLPSLPEAVEQVVMTSLAKDPKERFESCQAFAAALAQASTGNWMPKNSFSFNTPPISPTVAVESSDQTIPPTYFFPQGTSDAPTLPSTLPNPGRPVPISNGSMLPPGSPSSVQSSLAAPASSHAPSLRDSHTRKPWLVWLVVALLIALLGGIAQVVIPALIVYGPHHSTNNGVVRCDIGTGYDASQGLLLGGQNGNATYPEGTTIYLVCKLTVIPSQYQDKIVNEAGTLVPGGGGRIDATHLIYYNWVTIIGPGTFTWTFYANDLNNFAAVAHFTLTETKT